MIKEAVTKFIEAVRKIIEAVRKIIEAVRLFVEAVRLLVEAGRVLRSSANKSFFKFIEYLFEYISTQFPHLPLYSKERQFETGYY